MSYEVHVGKLVLLEETVFNKENGTMEQWYENYCKENGMGHLENFYDSWEACFLSVFSDEFVVVDDLVYRIIGDEEFFNKEIFEANKNELGQIEYCLRFHPHDYDYSEAIREAIRNMDK